MSLADLVRDDWKNRLKNGLSGEEESGFVHLTEEIFE